MITCNYVGGLGNQLFIIFNCINYALKYNKTFFFIYKEKSTQYKTKDKFPKYRPTYWNTLFKNLKEYIKNENVSKFKKINEKNILDIDIFDSNMDNIIFNGYYGSYKYFQENFDKIYNLIKFDEFKINILDKYKNIDFKEGISLHIRIGDYIYLNNVLDLSYYFKSLEYLLEKEIIKSNNIIYIFGDKYDEKNINDIIKKFELKYSELKFELVDLNIVDYEHLLMMSLMKINIIANSTFSYWSSILNKNEDKIVLCPYLNSKNNIEESKKYMINYYPKEWIIIDAFVKNKSF